MTDTYRLTFWRTTEEVRDCDTLSDALQTAAALLGQGWLEVRIEKNDGSIVRVVQQRGPTS